ncbi:hypothetical protein [Streptomyces sp. NBC_00083]|uniref:hypothetical protein n=1 Tax=Streptomyces sp. NBC_00083 TaxID=2975647 RepID=UPI002B1DFFDE|nr:hypothetical protein [Streptomyces sp. NBC_00083]
MEGQPFRGSVGEDCAVLAVYPAWKRDLAGFSRAELAGAAAAFTELFRRSTPYGPAHLSPVRPNADRDRAAEVVR